MRRVMCIGVAAMIALAGCSSGTADDLGSLQVSSPNDLRLAALQELGNNCDAQAPGPDITGASYMDCKVNGVPIRLSTYPSEKQAKDGADYYRGMGDQVHQDARWVIAVSGDPEHLERVVSAIRAKAQP